MQSSNGLSVTRYEPGLVMAAHAHDAPSLGIVVGGGFVERIAGSDRRYSKGCVTFCPAGVTHAQAFDRGGARQVIFTPPAGLMAQLADARRDLGDAPFMRSCDGLEERLLAEMGHDDEFRALACEGIMLEIVAAFGRRQGDERVAKVPAWLVAARDFIHAHVDVALDLASVARAAGRHEVHVAREFRRHYGTTVGAYQRRLKAEKAARLLIASRADITEIAQACGFASHAHLCRVFKAQFGVTPSAYRTHCVG